jgi:hypothetical protein
VPSRYDSCIPVVWRFCGELQRPTKIAASPQRPPFAASTMSVSTSRALGRYVCQFRSSPSFLRPATASLAQQRTSRRWASTDAAAAANPKIATIVDQISQLTLLETADLVSTLKVSYAYYKRTVDSTTRLNLEGPIGLSHAPCSLITICLILS